MNGQWYAEDSSYLTADSFCVEEPAEVLLGCADSSNVADQIREMLGEDYALAASFLEESWASGRSITSDTCRRMRNNAVKNVEGVTFADLNTLGSFFFSTAHKLAGDPPAHPHPADSPSAYRAAWLRDPLEELPSQGEDHASVQNAAGFKKHAYDERTLAAMTYQRACELLSVSEHSSAAQVKAAYRRMVSEWHPDRLERSGESVRAFATKQMAAINEAYHLLMEASPPRAC